MLYPYLNQVAISLNEGMDTALGGITIFPRKFTFQNFQAVFSNKDMLGGAIISISRVILEIVLSIATIFAAAYGLTRKKLPYRKQITLFLMIPAYVTAGTIPIYILYRYLGFINNYLEYTQGGLFVGFGIAILLWAVINTFRQIEANFNAIWNVNKNRSIVRQFTTYMTMLIVVPFLIVISSGLTAKVDEYVSLIADSSLGSFLVVVYQFLVKLAPFVIYWLLFTLVYVIIPNTKVKITDAMLAGVVTGTAFLAIQFVYVNGQVSLSQYNAVYGSFAAIPLLLFWLQLSWTIILYGAELCYVSQNLINFSFESDTKNISRRYKDYTLFIVLKIIISRFCQGQKPISANQIALEYNIPIRLVHDHIKLLVDTEIISEIYIEQNAERFYQPAIDVNLITVHFVFDKINRFGSENFKITDNENFSDIWQKLQALQQTINDESSKILIRDL
jgi:membrane protein